MIMTTTFVLALSLASAPLADAAEELARGENREAALARVHGAGKHGLWALADIAKKKSGAERGRLFEAMGTFGTPEAEWALLMELKQVPAPDTRAGVVRGLAHLKSAAVFRQIVDAASSPDAVVREAAADALVELGTKVYDRIPALLASSHAGARGVGVAFVARAGNRTMVEASLPAALADGDPIVQREAIALAVRTKDAVHAGALAKLARVRDEKVALAAVDGIVELRGYNGAYELAAIAADPDVLESVWRRAALAARSFGARSLDAFVLGIEKARDERRDAMAAMLATGLDDLELRLIVDMFADASSSRSTVARLVADRCGERAQATAFARLPSAPPTLRRVLIAYLRERSGAAFTSRLVARAGSGAQAERLAAIDLLGEAGDERGLNGLAGMLSDPSPEVRARVAVVVSRAADREVAKLLVARAGDEAPVVRAGVMRGLGRYIPGDPVATKTAKRALADPDESVRIAAIHALSGPRDAAVVRAFKARLFDSSTSERAAIAQALGKSTLPEAVVMLVDLATDSNAVVREHAVAALGGGR